MGTSAPGRGLFLDSTRLEVEEVGVAAGDWLEEPPRGEAVPEEESFFLATLAPSRSLLRESCSCWCVSVSVPSEDVVTESDQHTTRWRKPFIMPAPPAPMGVDGASGQCCAVWERRPGRVEGVPGGEVERPRERQPLAGPAAAHADVRGSRGAGSN